LIAGSLQFSIAQWRDDLDSSYFDDNYRNIIYNSISTRTGQNNTAKVQAQEIPCKTKTDQGKEVFHNVCDTLNEKMISIVSSTALRGSHVKLI